MIEKVAYMNVLYDLYKNLLTEKQREYLALYYQEDLSLSEIADEFGVSRMAIHDNIKRTERALDEYEAKLGLYEKSRARLNLYQGLKDVANGNDDVMHLITQLEGLE